VSAVTCMSSGKAVKTAWHDTDGVISVGWDRAGRGGSWCNLVGWVRIRYSSVSRTNVDTDRRPECMCLSESSGYRG